MFFALMKMTRSEFAAIIIIPSYKTGRHVFSNIVNEKYIYNIVVGKWEIKKA